MIQTDATIRGQEGKELIGTDSEVPKTIVVYDSFHNITTVLDITHNVIAEFSEALGLKRRKPDGEDPEYKRQFMEGTLVATVNDSQLALKLIEATNRGERKDYTNDRYVIRTNIPSPLPLI